MTLKEPSQWFQTWKNRGWIIPEFPLLTSQTLAFDGFSPVKTEALLALRLTKPALCCYRPSPSLFTTSRGYFLNRLETKSICEPCALGQEKVFSDHFEPVFIYLRSKALRGYIDGLKRSSKKDLRKQRKVKRKISK